MLLPIYKCLLNWARKNETSYAPDNFILMHFTKAKTKNYSSCTKILLTSSMSSSTSI
jgi:hypothetical protein